MIEVVVGEGEGGAEEDTWLTRIVRGKKLCPVGLLVPGRLRMMLLLDDGVPLEAEAVVVDSVQEAEDLGLAVTRGTAAEDDHLAWEEGRASRLSLA